MIRFARFQNCYGPEGTWRGGREKAPAAICRKVAQVADGGEIESMGDGSAVRSYTYVDDMVDGVYRLKIRITSPSMNSSRRLPLHQGRTLQFDTWTVRWGLTLEIIAMPE